MSNPTERDEAWFEALFAAHHGRVLAYARRRAGPADADDIVVEVFATAWSCRSAVPAEPVPWLLRCAWHRILARHRADARRARLTLRVAGEAGSRATAVATEPELDWVYDVLAGLDPDEAEILRLAAWEGLAPRDIAVVLGCTPGAARVRLHRARRKAEALCPPGVRRPDVTAGGATRSGARSAARPTGQARVSEATHSAADPTRSRS